MTYRLAETSDVKLYFDWANDPEVRKQSHNTEPIIWDNHVRWFNEILESHALMLIFFEGDKPIGQLRVIDDTISLSVDTAFRGKGVAPKMLSSLKMLLLKTHTHDPARITGEVKQSNTASIKAFEKAGFKLDSVVNIKGVDCNVYLV
jgi:UDP-2,4-diacetamido-2,4,6-trideoxy-beta-L-altropyranose hydrolase